MIGAVIFDMDGVISDTERLHFEADRIVLEELGMKIDVEKIKKFSAVPTKKVFETILEERGVKADVEALVEKKFIVLKKLANPVETYAGVHELINKLSESGFKLAVASSSMRHFVLFVLGNLGVGEKFDVVLGYGDYGEGKPSPDVYLMASEKLGVKPEHCLVFEDAPLGIKAGKSAGMKVIAITNSFSAEELTEADKIIGSVKELSVEKIKGFGG